MFKHIRSDNILIAFLVGTLMVAAGGVLFCVSAHIDRYQDTMKFAGCQAFSSRPVKDVPARCLEYYSELKTIPDAGAGE